MSQQGKHSRGQSDSPPEKQAKQLRPYQSPCESPHKVSAEPEQPRPSEREIAAANAARERLYGNKGGENGEDAAVGRLPTGPEPPAVVDVVYTSRADLQPVDDPTAELQAALNDARSADWATTCAGLVLLRRIVVHHQAVAWQQIGDIVPLVLKSVKSLRSSVSKTAIMTTADLIESFRDALLPHLDVGGAARPASSLLSQLLLKGSSNDKRFVIDEVQRTLAAAAQFISGPIFLERLLPYAAHKNPKVRGTVATVTAAAAEQMTAEAWRAQGVEPLLRVAGKFITDNTPEARNAAKSLVSTLHAAYSRQVAEKENAENLSPELNSPREGETAKTAGSAGWEAACKSSMSTSAALAVLKLT